MQSEVTMPNTPQIPPQVVGNNKTGISYMKGKLLGKGGFAFVYEMKSVTNNVIFADKMISKEVARKKSSQEKIRREIDLHSKLCHPNIVKFVETFEDEHFIHIILEYCGMKSLLHLMRKRKVRT